MRLSSVLFLVILLAACSQDPAYIENKGTQFFGREHQGYLGGAQQETYPDNSSRYKDSYTHPVEPAAAAPVAISDLPSPSQQPASTIQSAPLSSPEPTTTNVYPPHPGARQFIWPVADGKVSSRFGPKSDGKANDGVNISASEGEPVVASADGTVVYAGNELKNYGNLVIIKHEGGWMTAYAHSKEITVRKGDAVRQGDTIGYVGATGGVTSPQVHFVLRSGKTPVDPELYLPRVVGGK